MHLCSAYIAVGGDTGNVVFRGPHSPVSWPEVGLLQFIHGEDAVYNIEVVGEENVRPAIEKQRLASIYNAAIVEQLYPGRVPVMEMEMPGVSKAKDSKKRPAKTLTVTSLADEDEKTEDEEV